MTPRTVARQASLSIANSWSLLKLMSIGSVMPSNHLILCHPLLLLPSIFPSIRVFSNESVLRIKWLKWRRTKEPLDESERGEWKNWLKTQHSKTKIMASSPITSWQIDEEIMEIGTDCILGGSRWCRWWLQPWNSKTLTPWKKSYDQPRQCIKSSDTTLPTKTSLDRKSVV